MGNEQLEDPGQGGGRDLELEHAVVPLPLHAAGEVALEELLHGIQVREHVILRGLDFHRDNVAVSKPSKCTACAALLERRQPQTKRTLTRHNRD